MKSIILLLIASLLTSNAFASHFGDFTEEQLIVTNKLFELCPEEASQLLTLPYTAVTDGNFIGNRSLDGITTVYTFNFAQALPAPSSQVTQWSLVAAERITVVETPAPDMSDRKVEVNCEIKLLN